MLPDVPAIDKVFDYTVPAGMDGDVRIGTVVRIELHGRRVGGWVVREGGAVDRSLKPIAKVTGWGPPPDVVALSKWAAWRWAGRPAHLLGTASADMAVRGLPAAGPPSPPAAPVVDISLMQEALSRSPATLRLAPSVDVMAMVASLPGALVVCPSIRMASLLARRLQRQGSAVALLPREWAKARAGGGVTVVGTRAAAWAPVPDPAAIIVVDGHDEVYQEERAPTWHARDVGMERARRLGVPFVTTSPCPDLAMLETTTLVVPPRSEERAGWPPLVVVDRRREDPRKGMYTERLVDLLRSGGRVVCVLNRKGRSRLLACAACGDVAACERCTAAARLIDDVLVCSRCGAERPVICGSCGGQRMKNLRAGVTRVREELEALAGVPVGEVTGDDDVLPDSSITVGTEAVLHRLDAADAVAFLDFDQELFAPRFRANEQALALLARAARLVGGRAGGGRLLVQTRSPRHEVLDAALHGDSGRLSAVELERRRALTLPPIAAMALVSGAPAAQYVGAVAGVERLGPDDDGKWLLRAPDHRTLCDALAATPRPSGRLRIEVDPLRA